MTDFIFHSRSVDKMLIRKRVVPSVPGNIDFQTNVRLEIIA